MFANGGPKSGLGVGVNIGQGFGGGQIQYAINHDLHVGTQFGLRIADGLNLTFAPYGKYFLTVCHRFDFGEGRNWINEPNVHNRHQPWRWRSVLDFGEGWRRRPDQRT